jgi:hypothetical protein
MNYIEKFSGRTDVNPKHSAIVASVEVEVNMN